MCFQKNICKSFKHFKIVLCVFGASDIDAFVCFFPEKTLITMFSETRMRFEHLRTISKTKFFFFFFLRNIFPAVFLTFYGTFSTHFIFLRVSFKPFSGVILRSKIPQRPNRIGDWIKHISISHRARQPTDYVSSIRFLIIRRDRTDRQNRND